MILSWFRKRRRRRVLAGPLPEDWQGYFDRNLPFFAWLDGDEQARLQDLTRIFIAEKTWEGCGGLEVTDEIRVTVAAQACLLVLGMKDRLFEGVKTILVYPAEYLAEHREYSEGGIVHEGVQDRIGEAWYQGPVVLSWADALHGCLHPQRGANVVFHEFAHKLDMEDGFLDGTPLLKDRSLYRRWRQVMTHEYQKLLRRLERGGPTLLDPYGGEDPAEFFAVATECFFERPLPLSRRHAQLYRLLADYYGQDPAGRIRRRGGEWGTDGGP